MFITAYDPDEWGDVLSYLADPDVIEQMHDLGLSISLIDHDAWLVRIEHRQDVDKMLLWIKSL